MGTLSYMAPEQGLDGHCDVRSDIYSLGVAYYEALTGTVPFDADTPLAILMKHINDPLPVPRQYNPDIPEPFERVALKALAKRAEDRFQSAVAMADAMTNAAQEARIKIPATITLPQVDINLSSRPGGVAVFSGPARMQIPDAGFASGDTDITTGRHPDQPLAGSEKRNAKAKTFFTPPGNLTEVRPQNVKRAVLSSVAGIIFANILMLWLSGIIGWKVFQRTWPMEFVVVGILLIALMVSLPSSWLLIPGGIVLGNGFLLSYFVLSGDWKAWTFLWPVEPFLIAACIIIPFLLNRSGVSGRWVTRLFGNILLILSVIVFIVSLSVGISIK
jgi:hypothetical protein